MVACRLLCLFLLVMFVNAYIYRERLFIIIIRPKKEDSGFFKKTAMLYHRNHDRQSPPDPLESRLLMRCEQLQQKWLFLFEGLIIMLSNTSTLKLGVRGFLGC